MIFKGTLEEHVFNNRLSEQDAQKIAKILNIPYAKPRKISFWTKILHKREL